MVIKGGKQVEIRKKVTIYSKSKKVPSVYEGILSIIRSEKIKEGIGN